MRFAELDAVTVDAYGTLVELPDPAHRLVERLRARGVECSSAEVSAAFRAEVAHYRPRSIRGRDEATLLELRVECVGVFLEALGAGLDAAAFVPDFIDSLRFAALPGVHETLAALRARGLPLAVVANWDCSLRGHLERLGLASSFSTVVSSAEAGAEKPDPAIFLLALERLGVDPGRALHVGDERADEQGARGAGLRFRPAPLPRAFEGWT